MSQERAKQENLIGKELHEILRRNKNLMVVDHYGFIINDDGYEVWTVILYDKSKKQFMRLRVARYPGNKIVVINA